MVAVSGGVDSVVLLHLILHLSPDLKPQVQVAHFNHRLRGKQSDAEERFVKDLCRRWEVPCHTGRAPAWKVKSNLEARAREIRYRFLEKTARRLGTKKIAVAHHADDQAETFLIRWIQGAGLKGLGGIGVVRDRIVRPLLFVPRTEIDRYASLFRIPYRKDPTNRSDLFLRSRLRRLLTGLKKENPNLGVRAAVNSIFLRADESFISSVMEELFIRSAERHALRVQVDLSLYLRLPEALRFRMLQRMARHLRSNEYALPAEAVLKADDILRDSGTPKHYDLPSGLGLNKKGEWFELVRKA